MEFKPPKGLCLEGDVAQNWKVFIQKFKIFLEANEFKEKSDEIKVAMLLNSIGDEGLQLYNTFKLTEAQQKKYDEVVKAFAAYCTPRKSTVFNRYKFFNRSQQEGENFDHYQTELKKLAQICEFGDQTDSLIRDKIIIGIKDTSLQERLLREENINLSRTIDVCRLFEVSKQEAKTLQHNVDVNYVKKIKSKNYNQTNTKSNNSGSFKFKCTRCQTEHGKNQCPAFGQTCHKCGKKNHFKVSCKINSRQYSKQNFKKVKELKEVDEDESTDLFAIEKLSAEPSDQVCSISDTKATWNHKILINSEKVSFKMDTGADVNVLPYKYYLKLCADVPLQPTTSKIVAYGGYHVKTKGIIELLCTPENREEIKLKFVVIDTESKPILSLSTCVLLNLINRIDSNISLNENENNVAEKQEFIRKNIDTFTGLGELPFKYKIRLREDAIPVVKPIRRVPEKIKPKLKETLEKMETLKIISKVTVPTDWVNDLVIVEKSDKSLRICLSPIELNTYVRRELFQIPTVDELTANLAGKKLFTVLDMKDGFYQICLESASSFLCTFNTPFGRYKFNRLPFGLSSSPEVFQRENLKIFGDIKGVQIYFDDIIIAAGNEREHDIILNKVMKKARECNVKFNSQKIQYKINKVKYLGFIFSSEGLKPDKKQVNAIIKTSEPTNKKTLQKFLGVITYLHKFIPHMSDITAPLRDLLKNDVSWCWSNIHQNAFDRLKLLVSSAPTLKFFNPAEQIVLQSDASKDGLGACLLQNGQPVAYLSRSLTAAEKRYSMVEKELLGICFAVQKFHQFIYGHKIIVQTDHKPLVNIVKKDIHKSTNRIQRLLLKLLKYQLDVTYIPGRFMYISDYLSRNFINDKVEDDPDMMDVVHTIMLEDYLPISKNKLELFRKETKNDIILRQVCEHINDGWCDKNKLSPYLKHYYKIKDNLYLKDNILFFGDKVVVPSSMYQEMLTQIHGNAHLGIVKSKNRARSLLYWPNMTQMIENFCKVCKSCEINQKSNCKEAMISHELPKLPFHKIALDIAECKGNYYLISVDFLSKWIEILPIKNKTMTEIVTKLKFIFSVHGIPREIVCDNNPFNSYKFKDFSKEFDFDITYISPYHHQSNGLCEKAVGIAKNIIKKSNNIDEILTALLEYRATPVAGIKFTPSEILMGRLLRTKLPCTSSLLKPNIVYEQAYRQLITKQNESKFYYDKQVKNRKDFNAGDNVVIQNPINKIWSPGVVIQNNDTPRSYKVRAENNRTYVRNSIHLRHSLNPPVIVGDEVENNISEGDRDINNSPDKTNTSAADINNKSSCHSFNGNVTNNTGNIIKTRSGRVIKKPSRYEC